MTTSQKNSEICKRMEEILQSSQAVKSVFDEEDALNITKEECRVLVEYIRLDVKRTLADLETIYFRGHKDCMQHLINIRIIECDVGII